MTMTFERMATPLGAAVLVTDANARLRIFFWEDEQRTWLSRFRRHYAGIHLTEPKDPSGHVRTIERYFRGEVTALGEIPVAFNGTAFQLSVWNGLREIPAGTTISYGELARRIRLPRAVRAVGLANGSNPVGLVVPCHRVIGSDGSLTGYGGGLERKKWLLAHEARHAEFRLSAG